MTDYQFKAGDTVRLKSGGPLMTVEQQAHKSMMGEKGDLAVWCIWFEGNKKQSATFPPAALSLEE